jgi:hypothetical protein
MSFSSSACLRACEAVGGAALVVVMLSPDWGRALDEDEEGRAGVQRRL